MDYSDCVSKFELTKIFDSNVTEEQTEELKVAATKVQGLLSWDLSHDTVDVVLQIREMLESATRNPQAQPELEFQLEPELESVQSEKEVPHIVEIEGGKAQEESEGAVSDSDVGEGQEGSEGAVSGSEEVDQEESVIAVSDYARSVFSDEE